MEKLQYESVCVIHNLGSLFQHLPWTLSKWIQIDTDDLSIFWDRYIFPSEKYSTYSEQ